jgi:hypothetical protein
MLRHSSALQCMPRSSFLLKKKLQLALSISALGKVPLLSGQFLCSNSGWERKRCLILLEKGLRTSVSPERLISTKQLSLLPH